MKTPDILIIGAGIIGCSLARELARANLKIVLLERGVAGAAASSAAAGLLSPSYGAEAGGPLVELLFRSVSLYESWIDELRADGSGDVAFRRSGVLQVALDAEQAQHLRERLPAEARPGRRVEWLSAAELCRREPAVAETVLGATYSPDDAQVDPALLSRAVARVVERLGVPIHEGEPVQRMDIRGDRIHAVHTDVATYRPGQVVITAGPWSGDLASSLNLHLPTRPVKGQMLLIDCRVAPVTTPMLADHTVLAPQPDGRMKVGVTMEEAGFDDRVTVEGLRSILQRATQLVPALGQLTFGRAWAGLRPATPDGWPYMGPVSPLQNLWVSVGHFRKGIMLAPACARLMAQSIVAGRLAEELMPFKPNRAIKQP
jgi:glycine oxidase